MVGFRSQLQGVLQVLDGGTQFATIQFGNAHVVVIVSRSEDGPRFFMKFFFASVNEDFRSFLNLRLFGMLRNEMFKTPDSFLKIFGVHQLDTGLVRLDGVGKVF